MREQDQFTVPEAASWAPEPKLGAPSNPKVKAVGWWHMVAGNVFDRVAHHQPDAREDDLGVERSKMGAFGPVSRL